MKLYVNEVFLFQGLEWTITALVMNGQKEVVSFNALAFNGSYYETKTFNVVGNDQREVS